MPMYIGQDCKGYCTVLLMHLPDTSCVTARPYYIVVEFRKVCCSRELGSGYMAQGVKEEIISQFDKLVYSPSSCQDKKG